MSIADQVMEIQLIKSTLNRQALDNVYLQHGTELVVTGEADLDALMNRRPGNVIRAKAGTTVVPLAVPPMLNDIMESISYFDTVRDQRTGATRTAPGPGADSLNNAYTQTAAGAAMVETAGQERIAYIARTFAETGVKRAFRRIFELTCKHQNKAQVIKLRGQWVPINPTEWNDRMNLTVTVGLGTNNKTVAGAAADDAVDPSRMRRSSRRRAGSTARWSTPRTCTTCSSRSPKTWASRAPISSSPTRRSNSSSRSPSRPTRRSSRRRPICTRRR
jgi:hypothetical protein